MPAAECLPQSRALQRIRALSWPLLVLISIVLGASVIVALLELVALLGVPRFGSMHSFITFGAMGLGISIGETGLGRYPEFILVEALTTGQRFIIAGLAAACWACNVLALLQLRGLFALYSRGIVFSGGNVSRIKKFGLWMAMTAVVVNLAGRLFVRVVNAPVQGIANAALAIVVGVMIYVVGYVMELAREADAERKEFV